MLARSGRCTNDLVAYDVEYPSCCVHMDVHCCTPSHSRMDPLAFRLGDTIYPSLPAQYHPNRWIPNLETSMLYDQARLRLPRPCFRSVNTHFGTRRSLAESETPQSESVGSLDQAPSRATEVIVTDDGRERGWMCSESFGRGRNEAKRY
jgi:hypothetical protein